MIDLNHHSEVQKLSRWWILITSKVFDKYRKFSDRGRKRQSYFCRKFLTYTQTCTKSDRYAFGMRHTTKVDKLPKFEKWITVVSSVNFRLISFELLLIWVLSGVEKVLLRKSLILALKEKFLFRLNTGAFLFDRYFQSKMLIKRRDCELREGKSVDQPSISTLFLKALNTGKRKNSQQ